MDGRAFLKEPGFDQYFNNAWNKSSCAHQYMQYIQARKPTIFDGLTGGSAVNCWQYSMNG